MSNIRLLGILLSIIGFLLIFLYFRGQRWRKQHFILASFLNICLLSVSINPNIVNSLTDFLALDQSERGRIIALLISSNIFLWIIVLLNRGSQFRSRYQLDLLFRKLAVRELTHIENIKKKIKPIMVLIPAYNEADNLKILLKRMPENILNKKLGVLVVDDGSSDNTCEVVEEHGYLVVSNLINRGQGAASRLGYDILLKNGAEVIVTMDGDNQHEPDEIQTLVTPILQDKFDLVIGSRVLGKAEKDDPVRSAGVAVLSRFTSLATGVKITDCSSGFKAFNTGKMKSIQLVEDQFQASEVIIESAKKGLRIGEVPISIYQREKGTSKKGTNISYALNFMKIMVKTWWR